MDISTDNWFKYLYEDVLTEGLRDIGLPEFVIDYIEDAMPEASEKARMYIANNWKKSIGRMAGAYTIPSLQYEVFQFLHQEYAQYVIQQDSPNKEAGMADIEARTVEPYKSIAGIQLKRDAYDEERIKQNQQVKFVIDNLRNTVGRPMGTWRKAFMKAIKALSKAGVPSEKVETTKEYLRSLYAKNFHFWINQYSELIDFLNDDPTNYELIKDEYSIQDAHRKALEYLEGKEEPEFVMHTFDDGSYWYNLNVSSCDVEASRMGHCGSDSRGVLVSLRKKQGKRRESSSYVTMTWSENESILYQIKGRQNDAPPEETWDHIAWFINNYSIQDVEETGEHSNDYDGFNEMNEYLASQTMASFQNTIEDRMEKAEDYCAAVENRYTENQDEFEYGSIGYSLEEEGNDIYCYANAVYDFEIDLGWPGYSETDTGFKADAGDFKEIPRTYGGMRDLFDELGVDDMMYEMPGDDGDYDFNLEMLVGAQPEDQEFDTDAPATLHIRFRLTTNETLSVDEDGDVPEFDEFADNMLAFEEDTAASYREDIRQALAAGGYMAKSAYDRSREELMKITNLDKWHVKQAQGGLEFDWTADDGQPLHPYTGDVKFDSTRAQMYGTGTGNVMNINPDAVFRDVFGYGGQNFRFANMRGTRDLSVQFSRELSKLITAQIKSKRAPEGQQAFDFGDKYKGADPTMFLADDTDFAVFSDVTYRPGGARARYPLITIKWLYRMRVNPQSPSEEFEIIEEIAAYLNENEEVVEAAANNVIADVIKSHSERIQRNIAAVMDNQKTQDAINRAKEIYGGVLDQYGDAEGYGSTAEIARRVYAIVSWFEQNYAEMNEPQRYVMTNKFLIPMARNTFRSTMDIADADEDGKPKMFDELVARQVEMMGGQPTKMKTYNESVEDQIARIERLIADQAPLVENVDVRLYKLEVDANVSGERASKTKQLQDQLRGISNVTTVSAKASKPTGSGERVRYVIKFTLIGQQSRTEFVENYLVPEMNSVQGVEVINQQGVGWSAPVEVTPGKRLSEVTDLQEYGFGSGYGYSNFGGSATSLGAQRPDGYGSRPMRTPRSTLQSILDDWVEGGVMAYDAPMDSTDMRYHVMMPVEELLPFIGGKEYRGDMKDFEGRYRQFIKTGPTAPAYIAIGMNGRIKVTGNEDIIWFAKKSGLKEIPVFLSYQKQA